MSNRIVQFGLVAALSCGAFTASGSAAMADESRYTPTYGDFVTLAFESNCVTESVDHNVSLAPCASGGSVQKAQKWKLIKLTDGGQAANFTLMNASTGRLMEMSNTYRANVATVDAGNSDAVDQWYFTENFFYPGSYKIKNLGVVKWLGSNSSGNVQGMDDHMTWKVTKA